MNIFKTTRCPLAPKIKKKFLFFKSAKEGYHDYKLLYISKFMRGSIDYVVTAKCEYCGKTMDRHFVTHEELIRNGFKKEFLEKVSIDSIKIKEKDYLY